MITIKKLDLFEAEADVIVNPVNTVGVMGAGVAAQFAEKFPSVLHSYQYDCASGSLTTGVCLFYELPNGPHRFMAALPTKGHYREQSSFAHINDGLVSLISQMNHHKLTRVAMPWIGCGLGGLRKHDVEQIIVDRFAWAPHIDVTICER